MNFVVRVVAFFIVCSCVFPGAAAAAPVMLQITGVVEEVTDTAGVFSPPAVAGTPFTALLVYDSGVNDGLPDDAQQGSYVQSTSASLSIDIAGQTFATAVTSGFGIKVRDNVSDVLFLQGDSLSFTASDVIFPITFNNMSISMFLRDSAGTALPSDALPVTIDASEFSERWIDISGFSASVPDVGPGSLGIRLRPDSFTVVPEPGTWIILATGVALLGMRRLARRGYHRQQSRKMVVGIILLGTALGIAQTATATPLPVTLKVETGDETI